MSLISANHDPKKQVFNMQKPKSKELSEEELAWLNGETLPANEEKKPIATNVNPEVLQDIKYVSPTVRTEQVRDENTIVINNANKKVEVRFETSAPKPDGSSKPVVFSVTVNNAAVDATDDGISILMRNDLEIKPPTLVPMTIIVNEKAKYSVVYAGGKHRLGNFTNISFAII